MEKKKTYIVSVFLTKELNDSITLMKIVTLSLGTYTLLSEDYSYEPKRPTYQHDLHVLLISKAILQIDIINREEKLRNTLKIFRINLKPKVGAREKGGKPWGTQ